MINVKNVKLDTTVLDKFIANLGMSTDQAMSATAFQIEGYAKQHAPVDTGALKSSIHTEKVGQSVYWVVDGVEYGIYQELGTSKMAAHPFMIPAVTKAARDIINAVKKAYGG